jgi:hypothetical protein
MVIGLTQPTLSCGPRDAQLAHRAALAAREEYVGALPAQQPPAAYVTGDDRVRSEDCAGGHWFIRVPERRNRAPVDAIWPSCGASHDIRRRSSRTPTEGRSDVSCGLLGVEALEHLLGQAPRGRLVAQELERVVALTLGYGAQIGGVAEHLSHWHLRLYFGG